MKKNPFPTEVSQNNNAAWNRYWAKGNLHSCPGAFNANYDHNIKSFWHSMFAGLAAGARVLDVGTGNGAVALLALGYSRKNNLDLQIDGIDAATIYPQQAAERLGLDTNSVTFRGGISIENTDYCSARFDLLCSQYAIEYSDVQSSLYEAARILKPGGLAGFVVHHADASIIKVSQDELSFFQLHGNRPCSFSKLPHVPATPRDHRPNFQPGSDNRRSGITTTNV